MEKGRVFLARDRPTSPPNEVCRVGSQDFSPQTPSLLDDESGKVALVDYYPATAILNRILQAAQ